MDNLSKYQPSASALLSFLSPEWYKIYNRIMQNELTLEPMDYTMSITASKDNSDTIINSANFESENLIDSGCGGLAGSLFGGIAQVVGSVKALQASNEAEKFTQSIGHLDEVKPLLDKPPQEAKAVPGAAQPAKTETETAEEAETLRGYRAKVKNFIDRPVNEDSSSEMFQITDEKGKFPAEAVRSQINDGSEISTVKEKFVEAKKFYQQKKQQRLDDANDYRQKATQLNQLANTAAQGGASMGQAQCKAEEGKQSALKAMYEMVLSLMRGFGDSEMKLYDSAMQSLSSANQAIAAIFGNTQLA